MKWIRRNAYGVGMAVMVAMAGQAIAQDAASSQDTQPPAEMPAQQAPLVTTLEEVRALPPDEEELDLYTFDNPIKVDPNRFNNSYHPPLSPKEISENGGYLVYGLGKLMGLAAKGLKGIPGVKDQVQPAIARPPPLDLEQMDRAARISAQQGQAQDVPAAAANE